MPWEDTPQPSMAKKLCRLFCLFEVSSISKSYPKFPLESPIFTSIVKCPLGFSDLLLPSCSSQRLVFFSIMSTFSCILFCYRWLFRLGWSHHIILKVCFCRRFSSFVVDLYRQLYYGWPYNCKWKGKCSCFVVVVDDLSETLFLIGCYRSLLTEAPMWKK